MTWFLIWLGWTAANYQLIKFIGKADNRRTGKAIEWSEDDRNFAAVFALAGPVGTLLPVIIWLLAFLGDSGDKPASW